MTCKCDVEINEMLAERNAKLAFGFSLGTSGTTGTLSMHPVMIQTEKINSRGKRPPIVLATFCPFCGTRYKEATP